MDDHLIEQFFKMTLNTLAMSPLIIPAWRMSPLLA
jgi:hypothetical protein